MKNFNAVAGVMILGLLLEGGFSVSHAQILERVKEKVKEKVERKADEKVDATIDKTIDDVLEAKQGDSTATSSKKTKTGPKKQSTSDNTDADENAGGNSGISTNSGSSSREDFKSYSKFDFVPGEQVILFEDFSRDAIGDFPSNWNTDGTGEVVTLGGMEGRWLKWVSGSSYGPLLKSAFPDNYTMEFDIVVRQTADKEDPAFAVLLYAAEGKQFEKGIAPGTAGVNIELWKECLVRNWGEGEFKEIGKGSLFNASSLYGKKAHFSLWAQKQRIRMYIDETKIVDLPRAFPETFKYNKVNFSFNSELDATLAGGEIYLSNVRIAVGAPDMRSKLMTEGKLVTRGILFDVNSDKIKAASYGVLKEIAGVLKENPAVRVRIDGHTDSDGDEKSNLDLSKRRAASVKASLSSDFGIDASRMESGGKGESQPVSPNTTPEGKANNRRVEFIKL
jgi:OmpA-OmpF porin, OOP family